MEKQAKQLKVGDKYISGKTVQEVVKVLKISDKSIQFLTVRLKPEGYKSFFIQRKQLNTLVTIV